MMAPCALPSPPPWPTPTQAATARATAAPPAAATSSSSSTSTARPANGRWPASSSATCGSTTTCRSATSAPPAPSPKRASCAICWTRPSTRSSPWPPRSRSAATPAPGWTSSAPSPASTSTARSTADPITGRSGYGTASEPSTISGRPSPARPPSSLAEPALGRPPRRDWLASGWRPVRPSAARPVVAGAPRDQEQDHDPAAHAASRPARAAPAPTRRGRAADRDRTGRGRAARPLLAAHAPLDRATAHRAPLDCARIRRDLVVRGPQCRTGPLASARRRDPADHGPWARARLASDRAARAPLAAQLRTARGRRRTARARCPAMSGAPLRPSCGRRRVMHPMALTPPHPPIRSIAPEPPPPPSPTTPTLTTTTPTPRLRAATCHLTPARTAPRARHWRHSCP